ncbi:MAG: hypothetical protein Q9197_001094 [Variospora fuerteventurae]
MSSMQNAVQRRNHKERAQPAQREKWGVLEKHKDYSLRAKDYNEKKKRLKILWEKAIERNPDEFSYGMLSSKTDQHGRRIQDRGNATLSQDAAKLLKTQDAGYLKTTLQQTRSRREKTEQQFHLLNDLVGVQLLGGGNDAKSGRHIIFAVELSEQNTICSTPREQNVSASNQGKLPQPSQLDDTDRGQRRRNSISMDPRLLAREEVNISPSLKQERIARKFRKRQREGQKSLLKALKDREKGLRAMEQQLDHGRARMSNSVGGINKAGIKWKIRERKK